MPNRKHGVRIRTLSELQLPEERDTLPCQQKKEDVNIWAILKSCIGKDLTKITMPIQFNEPLSFLQRMAESLEYSYLLADADEEDDPIARMENVAAFAISAGAYNWDRMMKPFNPLLGETYELQRDGFKLVAEQVSHHPPISAFHAEHKNYIFSGSMLPKMKFYGKSVEIIPKGVMTVVLSRHGEAYTWSNVPCCVHNVIVGKLWIEQYGTMEITCHRTGYKAQITFKPSGWFSRDVHKIEGFILDQKNTRLRFLYGRWVDIVKTTDMVAYAENYNKHRENGASTGEGGNSPRVIPIRTAKVLSKFNSISFSTSPSKSASGVVRQNLSIDHASMGPAAELKRHDDTSPGTENELEDVPRVLGPLELNLPNSDTLWVSNPRPDHSASYYNFSLFTFSLNDLRPEMKKILCPTDCRLRPDIRKLEEGDLSRASALKHSLEEKQRESRKKRARFGKEADPEALWFKLGRNPHTKEEDWVFTEQYWERDFSKCPDIF